MILVLKEDVDDGGHEGIQEGKDGDGDEELGGGRVVSAEKDAVCADPHAGWRFEGHLVQPEGPREPHTSPKRLISEMFSVTVQKSLISMHRTSVSLLFQRSLIILWK